MAKLPIAKKLPLEDHSCLLRIKLQPGFISILGALPITV
jgi:hypothetical protein